MEKYVIVGNPNCGKTTLFNTLTKSKEKTANYNGVTVKEKSKKIKYNGREIEVVDLPGVYTINSTTSQDEDVAKSYLKNNKCSYIVFLCSSSNIQKNLTLLAELVQQGDKHIKVVINKNDKGLSSRTINQLENLIGTNVLQVDARKNRDKILDFLTNEVASYITEKLRIDEILKLFPTDELTIKKALLLVMLIWGG